jgi:hypothetical protein
MENLKFLRLPYNIWNHPKIRNLAPITRTFLIDLLFISYSFDHKPFYQSPKRLYEKCSIYHEAFYRLKKEDLPTLKIKVEFINKVYHFDLTEFFKEYGQV